MEARLGLRRKDFKQTIDDPLRRREDAQIQIRKEARENHLAKRRVQRHAMDPPPAAVVAGTSDMLDENVDTVVPPPSTNIASTSTPGFTGAVSVANLPGLVDAVCSDDPERQFLGAQSIRRLLSAEEDPPIQDVVRTGVIDRFVAFLRDHSRPELQFEAAWALTNIASGNSQETMAVVDAGAIPILVNLAYSQRANVREQAIWALGNIAGDSIGLRDRVLQAGALGPVLMELKNSDATKQRLNLLRYSTWALSNFCRNKPQPSVEVIRDALPVLKQLLHISDAEILIDACWTVSYLSDGSFQVIDDILASGICPKLVELLEHNNPYVQVPALRAVGNIVTGDDAQTQSMIQYQCLPRLRALLSSPKKNIRKEACWAVSNITAGNSAQIEEVILAGIIPDLCRLLSEAEFDVKREAAWGISNAVSGGDMRQVAHLVQCGCIPALVDLLDVHDSRIILMTLESVMNILRMGDARKAEERLPENPYIQTFDTAGGFQKLERLQFMPQQAKIQTLAMNLLNTYLQGKNGDVETEQINGGFGGMI